MPVNRSVQIELRSNIFPRMLQCGRGLSRNSAMETERMIYRLLILAAVAMLAGPTFAQEQQGVLPVSEIAPGFSFTGRTR